MKRPEAVDMPLVAETYVRGSASTPLTPCSKFFFHERKIVSEHSLVEHLRYLSDFTLAELGHR